MSNIIYSIVIPHKNIPRLLQRCLASIPEREDTEIIIVDNGSDNGIVDFDHFPGSDRRNVTILYDKESRGAGGARNTGLSVAKGKWLLFIDADDFFNYCIRDVLDEYQDYDSSDIVAFKVNSIDTYSYENSIRGKSINHYIDRYKSGRKKYDNLLRYGVVVVWGKLIRREIVSKNHILFEDSIVGNDVRFSLNLSEVIREISVDNRAAWCVTRRKGSLSLSPSVSNLLERIHVESNKTIWLRKHKIPSYCDSKNGFKSFYLLLSMQPSAFNMAFKIMKKEGLTLIDIVFGLLRSFPIVCCYYFKKKLYR